MSIKHVKIIVCRRNVYNMLYLRKKITFVWIIRVFRLFVPLLPTISPDNREFSVCFKIRDVPQERPKGHCDNARYVSCWLNVYTRCILKFLHNFIKKYLLSLLINFRNIITSLCLDHFNESSPMVRYYLS